ncbi:MAG: hypothetical protein AcusKO_45810 [Acuticoccus sp.]
MKDNLFHGLRDVVTSMGHARDVLNRHIHYRSALAQATRELDSMSSEDLNELGLSRCDIPRVARETAADKIR